MSILSNTDTAVERLAAYYRWEGDYAGAAFVTVNPNDPYAIEASDLFAVTLLNVEIPQMAARRILEPGATSAHLSRLLALDELGLDRNLQTSGLETLSAMGLFYDTVKMALAPHHVATSDRWVTAAKVCARKRPDLFPVRDNDVTKLLGTRASKSYALDWLVFKHLLSTDHLLRALDEVVDRAAQKPGVRIGDPNLRLRHLDVVLWTHANPPPGT